MAQAFDPASGKISGAPRVTRETVQIDRSTWNATITASDNGILVYGLGGRAGTNRLIWFDRSGARIKTLTGLGNILNIDLSHDGRRVAYEWQQLPLAVFGASTWSRGRDRASPPIPTTKPSRLAGRRKARGLRRPAGRALPAVHHAGRRVRDRDAMARGSERGRLARRNLRGRRVDGVRKRRRIGHTARRTVDGAGRGKRPAPQAHSRIGRFRRCELFSGRQMARLRRDCVGPA